MGERTRVFDWSSTSLGPAEGWPQSLKTAVSICLGSRYPIVLWWGNPAYTTFYNDGYIPMLGVTKHPGWLGRSGRECWKEIWPIIGPMLEGVFSSGEATWSEDLLLVLHRNLPREEAYFTFSYSPIRDDSGAVGGIFCAVQETTGRVIGERRLRTLRDLGRRVAEAQEAGEACKVAARTLESNPHDIPFALIYLLDPDGRRARLAAACGLEAGSAAAPLEVDLSAEADPGSVWPLRKAQGDGPVASISEVPSGLVLLPGGPWPEPPGAALVVPIPAPGQSASAGFLVGGLSPRRVVDADYRSFFDLIAGHVGTAVANARAHEEEKRRAEALAELDRAKTAFFSNVSHEFRTPLTLMLGPVSDILASSSSVPEADRELLGVVHRNGQRLLRLVNTLLDFSRIEAGRVQASFEPTDLATYTAELASSFRSACERGGLDLSVDCQPLSRPVHVDREMWEKIVLNLISNAFKFTFEGAIGVSLREVDGKAELRVRDTGTGIPEEEMPRIFERFHRVENVRGRTHEGSGIGLALVQELVKLHGGAISAESRPGQGSTFTVRLPLGTAHLPADRVGAGSTLASTATAAQSFVEEALRWLPDDPRAGPRGGSHPDLEAAPRPHVGERAEGHRPRVLVADDNADMRDYLCRLLQARYRVEMVPDGEAALQRIRAEPPDLVLSDVMMPHLDGLGLVRALRAEENTRSLPVILLSARAGEEARIEGLGDGASDYLIKPFSARDLLARIDSQLEIARVRLEAEERLRDNAERLRVSNAELERLVRALDESRRSAVELMQDAVAAKELLRYRKEHIETLLDRAPLGVFLVDSGFRIREVNPVALPVFGDIPGGVVGRDFGEIIHGMLRKESADEIVGIFRSTLETGGSHVAPERSEHRVDRNVTEHYEWRLDRITLPDGKHGLVCYFRDISNHVLAREALRRSEEALLEADRRKNEFLAMLAHELRNPLAPIRNAAQVLKLIDTADPNLKFSAEVIERQLKQLARLVDDLLDVARITQGKVELKKELVDLSTSVASAVEAHRPLLDAKSHDLRLSLAPLVLDADPIRLTQIVSNLLNNAIKYTPDGGRIEIGTSLEDGRARLVIRDSGQGIPAELLPRVFETFIQGELPIDRSQGGLGLGLPIVKSLVELHGGTIEIRSEVGNGTEVSIDLPSRGELVLRGVREESMGPGPVYSVRKRVLVVDDNADGARSMALILEVLGHEVRVAFEGASALKEADGFRPEVVFLDIGLPGMHGYEVAARLRQLAGCEGSLLVAVTGYGQEEDKRKAGEAGFDLHLTKPVSIESLEKLFHRS